MTKDNFDLKKDNIFLEKNIISENDDFFYSNDFIVKNNAKEIHMRFINFSKNELIKTKNFVSLAGRIMLKRIMGKVSFSTLQDNSCYIQIYISIKNVGVYIYENFKKCNLGDIIAIEGFVFKTNKGELSINCNKLLILSKSFHYLPDKYLGVINNDICYRKRYIDLIMNQKVYDTFINRSKIIFTIRNFMSINDFIEVETPILHPIVGGATAKPFSTCYNSLNNMKMFLRISPELYLKRLLIGGFNRIFEISKNFRNEGISFKHSPEFTMMEFYVAYTNYVWLMDFTENLIRNVIKHIFNELVFDYKGKKIDFSKPFIKLTIKDAIQKYLPHYKNENLVDKKFLINELEKIDINLYNLDINKIDINELYLKIFEKNVEHKIWEPTFIMDYSVKSSVLARESDKKNNISDRFELFIGELEVANGFSELNDPKEQSIRFKNQIKNSNKNKEFLNYDKDYIEAMEYGMPPASGCGIGIDRLVMLLTGNSNIRDVILFPHLKKK